MASDASTMASHGRAVARRVTTWARAHPYTLLVLIVGLALRAALMPIAHGEDFRVWDLASRYTLHGVNIYKDHPPYPGGPYAYVPLFLYVELPFQWLALRTGLPFTVLGKLPIVGGDILTAALIGWLLARRGCREAVVALGVALYFLNPLVLYNGAFYGRFDTLCVGLLLLALVIHDHANIAPRAYGATPLRGAPATGKRVGDGTDDAGNRGWPAAGAPGGYGWVFPLLYAAAVATKSYPVFLLPWLLAREPRGRKRLLLSLAAVLGGLSLPYLLTSPVRFVADILLYDAHKTPGHLSWQVLLLQLHVLSPHAARLVSYLLLALFVVALYLFRRLDLWTYATVSILLFILLSKVVIEQYVLWPLPFLILDALRQRSRRSWAAGAMLALLSTVGMLVNAYIYPFGQSPWPIALILAAAIVLYLATVTMRGRRVA